MLISNPKPHNLRVRCNDDVVNFSLMVTGIPCNSWRAERFRWSCFPNCCTWLHNMCGEWCICSVIFRKYGKSSWGAPQILRSPQDNQPRQVLNSWNYNSVACGYILTTCTYPFLFFFFLNYICSHRMSGHTERYGIGNGCIGENAG